MEELSPTRTATTDEIRCNELYASTVTRNDSGTFTVRLPFKEGNLGPERLGQSKGQAMARFSQLERKLERNSDLKNEYTRVMNEYLDLGHMRDVTTEPMSEKLYYIPHHAVFKPDSLTTKTRVVFDASAKSSTGVSLNDCMFIGAKQQDDLIDILIRWRKHKVVFKADIEKMYRQIALDAEDQKYHTVVWRNSPNEAIKEYQLNTVTFGTAAAPYLATRTLKQIAWDAEQTDPIGSAVIENDFYVDDLISGADSLQNAIVARDQVIKNLTKGGLTLRKWTSNSPEFLKNSPHKHSRTLSIF